MNEVSAPAGHAYFLPPREWFWQWQEHGRVAVWNEGPTIAFRDELEAILRHLTPQGLPPLGSLVLLLAACRDSWNETPGRAISLVNLLTRLRGASRDFASLRQLCDGLDRVRSLPSELRTSLAGRAELAAMVFETARQCTSAEVACSIVDDWPKWRSDETVHRLREASLAQLLHELHAVLGGLAKVDERTLRLRMKTGLDVLPVPAQVEAEPAESARSLLDKLLEDPELSGIARLAKQLLAVVSLPRPMADPAHMPEGGISDISNRGPLDRLLLSELANDSTTLAARVAMNEALYYRRETPPNPPPRARKLLLDSGIRMWGVPRVFAAAVGLAFAAQSDRKLETTVFRASGAYLDDVDFTTRDGVANHLAALETAAHPGNALEAFLSEIDEDPLVAEGVLITCEDVLRDREFQRQLALHKFDTLYVVSLERDGRYRLIARSRRGVKVLREATLDLDDILAPRQQSPKLVEASKATGLPAILGVRPFPLLLCVPFEADRSWHLEGIGAFTYTRDGRLLHWANTGTGARQLAEGLPEGKLFACEFAAREGNTLAVIGKLAPDGLYALRINYLEQQVTWSRLRFPKSPAPEVAIHRETVLLRHNGSIVTVDAHSGEVLSQLAIGTLSHQFGRVVTWGGVSSHAAGAIAWDGSQTVVQPSHSGVSSKLPLLAAFEARGIEGIAAVTASGDIEIDDGKQRKKTVVNHGLFPPLRLAALSRDGLRFVLQGQGSRTSPPSLYEAAFPRHVLVYTLTGAAREIYGDFIGALEPYLNQYMRPRILRSKFVGIGISREHQLTLVGRKRLAWPLEWDDAGKALRFVKVPSQELPQHIVRFEPSGWDDRGYSLHSAQWHDGTTVWLDSRGLLHLRSSNNSLPELTLVLCEGPLAGWLSSGHVFGPEYFHGRQDAVPNPHAHVQVLKPMIHCMA